LFIIIFSIDLESEDTGEMVNFLTDLSIYYQLPVQLLSSNLNADKSTTLHLKMMHAPCPASGIKTSSKKTAATAYTATSATQELSSTSTQLTSLTLPCFGVPERPAAGDPWLTKTQISKDLESLLNDDKLSDFTVYTSLGGLKPYKCHKAILAARSPVFKRLLSENALENRTAIAVVYTSPQSMKEFLSFVYTGAFMQYTNSDESTLWISVLPEIAELSVRVIYKIKHEITN